MKNLVKIKFRKKHLDQFRKMGIHTIYLFGSYAKGKTHSLSDIDFGIVFEKPEKYKERTLKVYSKLYKIFSEVLPKNYLKKRLKLKEHEFDLVFLQFAPLSLQIKAIQEGKVIYEGNRKKRFQYQEEVLKKYCDFEYFYNLFSKALIERI